MFWLDHLQSSLQKVSTSLVMDSILAPDSEEEDNQTIQANAPTLDSSKSHSSRSRSPDLPSWTTFSSTSSHSSSEEQDEIVSPLPISKKRRRGVRPAYNSGPMPNSNPDPIQPQPAAPPTPPPNSIPADISTHSPTPP